MAPWTCVHRLLAETRKLRRGWQGDDLIRQVLLLSHELGISMRASILNLASELQKLVWQRAAERFFASIDVTRNYKNFDVMNFLRSS